MVKRLKVIEFLGGTINRNEGYVISSTIRNALFAHIGVVKELVGRVFKRGVIGYIPRNRLDRARSLCEVIINRHGCKNPLLIFPNTCATLFNNALMHACLRIEHV